MSQDMVKQSLERREQELKGLRKKHLIAYSQNLQEAKERGIPVVWALSIMPVEIPRAMGCICYYPELETSVSTSCGEAGLFCGVAERKGGFSRDLCSLMRGSIGMAYEDYRSQHRFLPHPDLVIGEGSQCDAFSRGWEVISRYYNVPLFRLDGPWYFKEEIKDHELEWGVSELRRMVAFIEEHTGRKLDMDVFKEVMRLSANAFRTVVDLLEYRKAIPEPRSMTGSMRDWSYMLLHIGTKEAMEYWSLLLEDVKERVNHHIGAVENERFRLWYDQAPVYHKLDWVSYLENKGAVFCLEPNWLAWMGMYLHGHDYDPDKPFETLALKHFYGHLNLSLPAQIERAIRVVKEYHIDGAIIPANTSCKIYSQSVFEKSKALEERCGIPSLVWDVDCFDDRDASGDKLMRDTQEFLEILETSKHGRR
jgi:benzoyl-CoA reductase/2-hydroxyglutaryl-CoA dehydratase subunit BcrC/BadD/HgdB